MVMLKIVGIMLLGICIGFLSRKKELKWIRPIITSLIWILLFLLGIEVGCNRRIIEGLHTLGLEAIVLSIGSTIGSILFAWLLWRFIGKRD